MRSMDQGKTFQVIKVPFGMGGNENGRGVGERLAIDPNDNNILYFGSRHDGLWVSKDTALTWNKVGNFPVPGTNSSGDAGPGLNFVVFDPANGTPGKPTGTIYVGATDRGEAQLYWSTNAGEAWQPVPGPTPTSCPFMRPSTRGACCIWFMTAVWGRMASGMGRCGNSTPRTARGPTSHRSPTPIVRRAVMAAWALTVGIPGTLVVASLNRQATNESDHIYRTTDGGATWKDISAKTRRDPSASPYLFWGQSEPSLGWWMATLAIDPFDSNHVCYATGATLWNTDDIHNADLDKETHWSVWAEGIEETAVMELASPPTGAHLISAFGDIGGFTHDNLNVSPKDSTPCTRCSPRRSRSISPQKNPKIFIRSGSPVRDFPDRGPLSYSLDGGHHWKPFSLGGTNTTGRWGRGRGWSDRREAWAPGR